jgi:hypothetical protein
MLKPGTKEWDAVFNMASPELKAKMQLEASGAKNNSNPFEGFADMFGMNNRGGGFDPSQFVDAIKKGNK